MELYVLSPIRLDGTVLSEAQEHLTFILFFKQHALVIVILSIYDTTTAVFVF